MLLAVLNYSQEVHCKGIYILHMAEYNMTANKTDGESLFSTENLSSSYSP